MSEVLEDTETDGLDPLTPLIAYNVFSRLDNLSSLATCQCVCRSWRVSASDDRLWRATLALLEPASCLHKEHERLGITRYAAWRYQWWKQPSGLLIIQHSQVAESQPFTQSPRPLMYSMDAVTSVKSTQPLCPSQTRNLPELSATMQQPTWNPNGKLLAIATSIRARSGMSGDAAVQINDATGRVLLNLRLGSSYIPFFLYWSACGNYLLMLSNWRMSQRVGCVGMRVIDVASALIPDGPGPRIAFVGAGRPLYCCWSPVAPAVYIHSSASDFALWDVHTADGDFHPFTRAIAGGNSSSSSNSSGSGNGSSGYSWCLQPGLLERIDSNRWRLFHSEPRHVNPTSALTWFVDPAGKQRLVWPKARPLSVSGARVDDGCSLYLLDALEPDVCAAEMVIEWPHMCGHAGLFNAVNCDGSLFVCGGSGGLMLKNLANPSAPVQQLLPLPNTGPNISEIADEDMEYMGARYEVSVLDMHDLLTDASVDVRGVQWSPDGRKLLALVLNENDNMSNVYVVIIVFGTANFDVSNRSSDAAAADKSGFLAHLPVEPKPAKAASAAALRPVLVYCVPVMVALTDMFNQMYCPFFDQYKLSMSLWRADSEAFCFPAQNNYAVDADCDEPNCIYIQELKAPWRSPPSSKGVAASYVPAPTIKVDMPTGPLELITLVLPKHLTVGSFSAWPAAGPRIMAK